MIEKIHHVGIVVRSLDEALVFYRDALGLPVHKSATIQDQGVKAALLTLGDSELELLEPIDAESGVARFLERRGEGLHHICFQTDDVEGEMAAARAKGVELIDQEPRRGVAGLICFCHPRAHHGTLVELAQPLAENPWPAVELSDASGAGERRASPLLRGLDHLVLAVRDLDAAARTWEANLGLKAEAAFQPEGANFRLAALPVGGQGTFLELITPLRAEHRVGRFLDEQGEGMFSVSCRVDDVEEAVSYLREKGATVSEPEPGVFEGTRVARVNRGSAHGVALQLIELGH